MKKSCAVLLLAAACPAVLSGCATDPATGWTFKRPHVAGVRTVAVPIWTRARGIYRRGLEFRVTEAVKKQIERDTEYKITSRARADTLLTGTLDSIVTRSLAGNPDTGWPREIEITLVMSFTWTDLRTGKAIRQKSNVRVAGTYLPSEPFGQEFFQGFEDVANKAARRVVEHMEADW